MAKGMSGKRLLSEVFGADFSPVEDIEKTNPC
jgi:hypothetical protein